MKKTFWDRTAKIYDRFMRKDAAAYERLYELLRPVVRHKTVLELATGTGIDCQKYREQRQSYRGHGCIVGDDRRSAAG